MINHALNYSQRGWHIFPCGAKVKTPLTKHGCRDATTDEKTIRAWWQRWPEANIGLACGEASGVYAVDIDYDPDRNVDGFESLEKLGQEMPNTVVQITPRGGAHYLFSTDDPPRNKNSLYNGIDIRGDGYYIILTPSTHPNGKKYQWMPKHGPDEIKPAEYPDHLRPKKEAPVLPWDKPKEKPKPVNKIKLPQTDVIDRAKLYLKECEPATQGQAGHDALLWAARALVVGFELDEGTAIQLLWSVYNPMCNPPWDPKKESKDFERKVREVRKTPGTKPSGWLLEEYGLRSNDEDAMAYGKQLVDSLLASVDKSKQSPSSTIEREPFPLDWLPPKLEKFARTAAKAHGVDLSVIGLPMLVVAGAAMGNCFRLKLKEGYFVPAVLWGAIVAPSGTNKSGPLGLITEPLRRPVAVQAGNDKLNPQHRLLVGDATTEAIINRLKSSYRGLCCYQDELGGWIKSLDAYKKKSGGDEQKWLNYWDAKAYQLDRKTDNEEVFVSAAAVSVIGGIQPAILAECFDPSKFYSGLVPRLLVTSPPERPMYWSEEEISEEMEAIWFDTIGWLQNRPFKSCDTKVYGMRRYLPHVLTLSKEAKGIYVEFYNQISEQLLGMDEKGRLFASKTRVMAARLALAIHGLWYGETKGEIIAPVSLDSMQSGIKLAPWFLNEQLRTYDIAVGQFFKKRSDDIVSWMKNKKNGSGKTTVRELHQHHAKRYQSSKDAKTDLDRLVEGGQAKLEEKDYVLV